MSLKKDEVLNLEFEIDKSKGGQYFFRIKASNGKILAHSEEYRDLYDCQKAVELIQQGARTADVKKVFPRGYLW